MAPPILLLLPFLLSFLSNPAIAKTQIQSDGPPQGFISAIISEKGLVFVKDLLIQEALSSLTPLHLPKIQKSIKIPFLGGVHISLSNITLSEINVSSSVIKPGDTGVVIVASGATANMSMDWRYSYHTWLIPVDISDKGRAFIQGIQRVQVLLDRNKKSADKITQLESKKEKLRTVLEAAQKKINVSEGRNAELTAQNELVVADIVKLKAETHELKAAAGVKAKRVLELEAELNTKKAELEASKKENADLQASLRGEVDKAYQDGVDEAMKDYETQIDQLGLVLYKRGWRAALKAVGVPDDHSVYQNLPKLESQTEPKSTATPEVPENLLAPADAVPQANAKMPDPPEAGPTAPKTADPKVDNSEATSS